MATYDKYENLPGVKVNYEDGNLFTGAGNQGARTQAVLLIGTAIDGPVGQVVGVAEAGGATNAEALYGGQLKKEVREAVASIAEYNGSYNTTLHLGENVIKLAKATDKTPLVLSSLQIREAGTLLSRVQNIADLERGKYFYDEATGLVKFFEPMLGVKVTYEVLKDVVVEVPHRGTLVRAMHELLNAGNEDVRMLRINGSRAQLALLVQNKGTDLTDQLGTGGGSQAFSGKLNVDAGTADSAHLVAGANEFASIRYVREIATDGSIAKEYTGNAVANVIASVDSTPGSEAVNFRPGVFRPKNKIEIGYQYTRRTFTQVFDNEGTGNEVLSKSTDASLPLYFTAPNAFWSEDALHAADFTVYVESTAAGKSAVPQFNIALEQLWGFGKDAGNVPTKDGGVSFTAAYNNWAVAQSPQYPQTTDEGFKVTAGYWYYTDSTPILADNIGLEYNAPGADQRFTLRYAPTADFRVFYEDPVAKVEVDLVEKTASTSTGVYTVDLSGETPVVTIDAGAVPVAYKLFATYSTLGAQKQADPYLLIEGKYEGSVYGRMIDEDADLYSGVEVEVKLDEEGEQVVVFYKPTEKQLTSKDLSISYSLRRLRALTTLGEFANYVNNDVNNNIVRISTMNGAATLPIKSLIETNGKIRLGSEFNSELGEYQMKVDDTKMINDEARYPLCGTDGFFSANSLQDSLALYETLGGVYVNTEGETKLVKQGIYNKIESYPVDIIVLLDAYSNTPIGKLQANPLTGEQEYVADDTKNFATQLAQHCAVLTAKTAETIGFIGVAPVVSTDLLAVQEYINEVTNTPGLNDHFMYNEATHDLVLSDQGKPIDIGGYVNVIFGPETGMTNAKIGSYVASPVSLVAGLVSTLNAEVSSTNKEIAASAMRYTLSESQMNQLAGARYVTIEQKRSLNGSTKIVVKDGVTAAQPNSDYQRLSTMRITHTVVQVIRLAADPYIGLPNGLAQRNALSAEIQAALDKLKERGVIQDFKYQIYTSSKEMVLGNAFITLELVPQFEMRKIHTSVSLRASL